MGEVTPIFSITTIDKPLSMPELEKKAQPRRSRLRRGIRRLQNGLLCRAGTSRLAREGTSMPIPPDARPVDPISDGCPRFPMTLWLPLSCNASTGLEATPVDADERSHDDLPSQEMIHPNASLSVSDPPPELHVTEVERIHSTASLAGNELSPELHVEESSDDHLPSHKETIHPNALRPVNNLPPELLVEIFATVCFSPIESTNAARRTRTTPLTLIQICSHWRHLILSTPFLWSWLLVRMYEPHYTSQLELIEEWIARTSPYHLLTIEISFDEEEKWAGKPPHELMQLLLTHAQRWRSIDLTLPEDCYDQIKSLKASFPQLQRVALQPLLSDAALGQSERKRLDIFKDVVPALSHLRLNGYYLDDCLLPWTQLQDLVLQHVYIDECFFALNETTNLVSCTLSTMLANDCDRTVNEHPLVLRRLESLKMQGASGADQATLLNNLNVPSLSELALAAVDVHATFEILPELILRSGCLLRVLDLSGFEMVESLLVVHMNYIRTLEVLKMAPTSGSLSGEFLGCLANYADGHGASSDSQAPAAAALSTALSDGSEATENTGVIIAAENSGLLSTTQLGLTSSSSSSASLSRASSTRRRRASPSSVESTDVYLPNLTQLEYDGLASFDESVMMNMLRARCGIERLDRRSQDSEGGQTGACGVGGGGVRRLAVVKMNARNRVFGPELSTMLWQLSEG